MDLRKRILNKVSDFVDNRVEPSSEIVHSGKRSLRCYAVPKSGGMMLTKAFLGTEMLHYMKGDDVWFSGWYYLADGGKPFTILDLETTWYNERPGIRLMLLESGYLIVELKWFTRAKYRQRKGHELSFPVGRWVNIKTHYRLSEKDDGIIEVWQDNVKIIDARGQTLLLPDTIYNYLEVGITAHTYGQKAATLYIDDIVISDRPN